MAKAGQQETPVIAIASPCEAYFEEHSVENEDLNVFTCNQAKYWVPT